MKVSVEGREIEVRSGEKVLEACRRAGFRIPTLCHHPEVGASGNCWLCAVEVEGFGLVRACLTPVWDGMSVKVASAEIEEARRRSLELLLEGHWGDCIAPCRLACPADVDTQGYVALIREGRYLEALALIMRTNPFPGVCGRVCPHPCEDACRRGEVDEPVALRALKRFVADLSAEDLPLPRPERRGRKVGVVGSGPAGLSAAYFLALKGYEVEVFEALSDPGGVLRYGIPRYRLPLDVVWREIGRIEKLGVKIRTGMALGRDFGIEDLRAWGFEAVFLGLGAWEEMKLKIPGEDLPGVLSGLEFLRRAAEGSAPDLQGKRVVVIGGGNVAVDAARTALRLGAREVRILYRRSRSEMPASPEEVAEAEDEGVRIEFLVVPLRFLGERGLRGVECVRTKLGPPDERGRRSPIPVPGTEFVVEAEVGIAAIGQRPRVPELPGVRIGRGGVIEVDPETQRTSEPWIFAGGDAATGPATVVEAIGAGRRAAEAIDRYLRGEEIKPAKPFTLKRPGLLPEELAEIEKAPRIEIPKLKPWERRSGFSEVESAISEEMARREASRCLECGCKAQNTCEIRNLASELGIPSREARRPSFLFPKERSHPFVEIDPNKCTNCERCVRICEERGAGVLSLAGGRIFIPQPLVETSCRSCGECAEICPTGALASRFWIAPDREERTICTFCGCGCGVKYGVVAGKITRASGDEENPVSRGYLCVKGRFGFEFVNSPERLTKPLVRRNGEFVPVSWDEALDLVASKFSEYKGGRFALIASAKCTNEENYLLQKFTRLVMKTNNIDHCARLCHAPTVAGLARAFGSGAMTNSIEDLEEASCILAIGTNTTAAHPLIGTRIRRALRRGAKLIVANPRRIDLCRWADIWLQHRPGTDLLLLLGMAKIIAEEGLCDEEFIRAQTEGFEELVESLRPLDLREISQITGIELQKLREAARLFATSKPAAILYGMGITQHVHGTDNVLAIANLALLTGNIGKPGSGVNPLRGQNNVQGACDMGALPNVLPGYVPVADGRRKEFEEAWGDLIPAEPGLMLTEIFEAARRGEVKALYIVGENPAISDPDVNHVEEALRRVEFLVVQDIFLTETARFAHVVLPAASFAEKEGTFTNTERRVQLLRKVIDPVGESKPDWQIICEIARRMKARGFDYAHPSEIFEELRKLIPSYRGISWERLRNGGIQWPCPSEDHPGTPILHTERFATPTGKGRFAALSPKLPIEPPDDNYPFILTTERSLYHFHTGTMTRKVRGLEELRDRELVEVNPEDAQKLGLRDGDKVRVISRRGEVEAQIKVTSSSPPGVITMDFHFSEAPTNKLTNPARDPSSGIPELKFCAVRLEPVRSAENIKKTGT